MKQLPIKVLKGRFALIGIMAFALGITALLYVSPSFGAQNSVANAVVDIRLVPDSSSVNPDAQFKVAIQVEPNGQQVAGVQVFVNFDPAVLQVLALTLDNASPLAVELLNRFDNPKGEIDFAAGSFISSPDATFIAANITFTAADFDAATMLSFSSESPRETIASVGADDVLRNLIGSEITIGNPLTTPTPSPIPTETPTSEPTATPIATNTPVPTPTPTNTATPTPTPTPTATPTSTSVPNPTSTPLPSQVVDIRLKSNVDSVISGESFTVAVIVEPNGQEVTGVEIFIKFDPASLIARNVNVDPSSPLNLEVSKSISQADGLVQIGTGVLGPGPDSAFTMANIEFEALNVNGTTEVTLSNSSENKSMASIGGFEVQRNLFDATVTIVIPPTPLPTPESKVDLNLNLKSIGANAWVATSSTFEVIIQVEPNSQKVSGIQTFLDFDPAKITVSSVKIAPGSPFDLELRSGADNNSGSLTFAAGTLGEPVTQPFDLAVIEFIASSQPSTATIQFSTSTSRSTLASVQGVEVQRHSTGIVVQIGPHADLLITKTGSPRTVRAGDLLTYTISVQNVGPEPAIDAVIRDALPVGMKLDSMVSSQGECDMPADVVVCDLGDLASGATAQVLIFVRPDMSLLGKEVVNELVVKSPRFDPVPWNNTTSTTVQIPAISDIGIVAMAGVFAAILLARLVRDAKQG